MRTDCERINFVLFESELFDNDGKTFWSNSVLDRLNKRKEKSVKAKESADKRWAYANALRLGCDGNAIKDSKPKETKQKDTLEKFEFSFEFLNNDPLRILFDEWFKFKQNSKDKFDNQASIEASFKMLQNYSKNNIVKATELVNAAIAANAKNLFNIESKPEPIVIPKHHMPR